MLVHDLSMIGPCLVHVGPRWFTELVHGGARWSTLVHVGPRWSMAGPWLVHVGPRWQGEGTGGIWGPHEGVYVQKSILNSGCKDLNRLKLRMQRWF